MVRLSKRQRYQDFQDSITRLIISGTRVDNNGVNARSIEIKFIVKLLKFKVMSLIKNSRSPFSAIPALVDNFLGHELLNWDNSHFSATRTTIPAVNILESADHFQVEVAAPGMDKQDFKIQLDNNLLTISSQKEDVQQADHQNYTRKEFSYQSFQRSFLLPRDVVNDEGIGARYENGVLYLTIPKREEARQKGPRLIEIS